MIRMLSRLLLLALGMSLATPTVTPVFADGRPADAILKDYQSIVVPKPDPSKKDPVSVREYRDAYARAEVRKSELALELFQAHPDHEQVPALLRTRWISTMMDEKTAAATMAEIDQAMSFFKDDATRKEASFMKVIATIRANTAHPELALPAVDAFLKDDPQSPRAPVLLSGYASEVREVGLRVKILERLVKDYPESPASKAARSTLGLLANLGKPLDLEFVDAIHQTTVSIKGLKGKVVVLDFWATWCGPCVAEMPRMKALYARFKDQGVEFIGVSLDAPKEEGGLDKLKAFVAKNEIAWPQFYQGNGWDSEFSLKMGISSIPQLFLIDTDGKLVSIDARGKLETLIPEYLVKSRTPVNP